MYESSKAVSDARTELICGHDRKLSVVIWMNTAMWLFRGFEAKAMMLSVVVHTQASPGNKGKRGILCPFSFLVLGFPFSNSLLFSNEPFSSLSNIG